MRLLAARRRRAQGGFTFVELVMTIAITAVFSIALYGAFMATIEMGRGHESQATAQAEARNAMDLMARDIRQSISANAGLTAPVDTITPTQLVIYVDMSRDPAAKDPRPYRIRYRLDGTRLLRETAAPIGAAPPYTYPAYGPEDVLVQGVANGAAPVFTAVTREGVPMSSNVIPPASRDVAQIGLRILVANANGNDRNRPTELTTDVALRNAISL